MFDKFRALLYYYVMTPNWNDKKAQSLFDAILLLKTRKEVASFCRDLMTEAEIEEFASRWDVAKALDSGKSQRTVSSETGVSIATVTRVNQWLKRGMNGYRLVLDRIVAQRSMSEVKGKSKVKKSNLSMSNLRTFSADHHHPR